MEALDHLLRLIARYPRGTRFALTHWPAEGAEIEALVAALRGWTSARGYELVDGDPAPEDGSVPAEHGPLSLAP